MRPDGQYLMSRWEDMLTDRRPVEEWWQLISEYVLPRKSYVTETEDFVDDQRYRKLFDTTAVDACQTLGNGHSSYITPGTERWFYWGAPEEVKSDEVEAWYRKCSEIAALELASSNFYTQTDEGYLDRSGFGLAVLSCWPGKRTALNTRTLPINSYVLEEDEEGMVDTIGNCMERGIRQLHSMFGEEAIARSEKLANAWKMFRENGKNTKHKVIHFCFPREEQDRDPRSKEGKHLPIASVYVCQASKQVILESGFEEMPYCATRFLKHTGRGDQYGFSPSWRAMPAIGQLNFLEKVMDAVAERQAFPPVLIPDDLKGEVDLRAGGMTMFRSTGLRGSYGLPQEWANQGRYDVGIHRTERKQDEINRAFHVDLFRMFASLDRPNMTATEVAERAGEKMIQFSPSFTRFVSDFQVYMRRVFGVLLRQGRFPPPPAGAILQNPFTGALRVENPRVVYQSKIALALQQLQNTAVDRLMQRVTLLVEAGRADVLDNLDLDGLVRQMGRNDGVPEEIFTPQQMVDELRARRAEQQEQERQMAMAAEGAKAAGAVGLKVA